MINKKRLIRLTQELIRINSENPPGDERAIASFVAAYLKKMGLKPKVVFFSPKRSNVLAVLKGKSASGSLLMTPHLDTVPAGRGWKHGAFSGARKGGRIYGRGATDCKGNLAVALEACQSLLEDNVPLNHDLIFLATADEEAGSGKGLLPFLKKSLIRPAAALILDSDEFNIITAQKGLIHFKVKVRGTKSHGAYPHRGVNAVEEACRLIALIKKIRWRARRHPLLRPPTVNIGTIAGGDKVNIVADWCYFEVDLRFLPGMSGKKILSKVRRAFKKTGIRFAIEVSDLQEPYEIDPRHPLVRSLQMVARKTSRRSQIKGSEGATVITFFKKRGIPAVATGYGRSGCAHVTDEYVREADLVAGAQVIEKFIKMYDARRRPAKRL